LSEVGNSVEVVAQGIDADKLPCTTENVAYQAAKTVFDHTGYVPKGLRLCLTNGIPAIRGLGGSGTAILGGLLTANALAGACLSQAEVLDLATQIEGHPDNVAASLLGGLVVSVVEGGRVNTIKLSCSSAVRVVVAIPDFPLSTKQARGVLPKTVSFSDAIYNVSHSSLLVAAIATNRFELLSVAMKDRLHQPYRSALIPGFDEVCRAAIEAGAVSVALSGAGPSIAAYCVQHTEPVAQRMQDALRCQGIACEVKTLAVDMDGATVRTEE